MIESGNHSNPGILIVDDEIEVLNSLADLLRHDFHVLATSDPREALDALSTRDTVTIIISDQRMPVMTGADFLALAAEVSPETPRILMTAYSDINGVIKAVNRGKIIQYITKPWDSDALLETLKLIAERHLMYQENQRLVSQLIRSVQPPDDLVAPDVRRAKYSIAELRDKNRLLTQACQQIERSRWLLESIKSVMPMCLRCGKLRTEVEASTFMETMPRDKPLVIGHGCCPECLRKIKTSLAEDQ